MANAISIPSKISLQQKLKGIILPTVLLSCERSYNSLTVVNDMTMAEAFRLSWTCKPLNKRHPPVIAVCHLAGTIKKIYMNLNWRPTDETLLMQPGVTMDNVVADEWAFTGDETHGTIYQRYIGLDLSQELTVRGMANPVRYLNCD